MMRSKVPWRDGVGRSMSGLFVVASFVTSLVHGVINTVMYRNGWPATSGRGQAPPGGRRPPWEYVAIFVNATT